MQKSHSVDEILSTEGRKGLPMKQFSFGLFRLPEGLSGIAKELFSVPEEKFSIREWLFCLREGLFGIPEGLFSLPTKKEAAEGGFLPLV
jgi:hypothetical protein